MSSLFKHSLRSFSSKAGPTGHIPVLLKETLHNLNIEKLPSDAVVVDATFGAGGHAAAILGNKRINIYKFQCRKN